MSDAETLPNGRASAALIPISVRRAMFLLELGLAAPAGASVVLTILPYEQSIPEATALETAYITTTLLKRSYQLGPWSTVTRSTSPADAAFLRSLTRK